MPMPSPLVFLLDDDADSAEMYAMVLGAGGFRVVTSDSLADALSRVYAVRPDVIVADMRLPDGSGLELVRHIRTCGVMDDAPVIVLTACAFPAELAEATMSGCDEVITKPCSPDALAVAVGRGLDEFPLRRVINRVRAEFLEMTAIQLTPAQVQRLCGIDPLMCIHALDALVDAGFLYRTPDRSYARVVSDDADYPGGEPSGAVTPQEA